MPLYEYRCRECDHRFEVLQRMGETGDGLPCPRCEATGPERELSTFAGRTGAAAPMACDAPGGCACAGPRSLS